MTLPQTRRTILLADRQQGHGRKLVDTRTWTECGKFSSATHRHYSVYQPDFFEPNGPALVSITADAIIERDPRTGAERTSVRAPAVWRKSVGVNG